MKRRSGGQHLPRSGEKAIRADAGGKHVRHGEAGNHNPGRGTGKTFHGYFGSAPLNCASGPGSAGSGCKLMQPTTEPAAAGRGRVKSKRKNGQALSMADAAFVAPGRVPTRTRTTLGNQL